MRPADALARLGERFAHIAHLEHAATYLGWDRSVMMPPRGNTARAEALGELAAMSHAALVAPEVGDWLDEAAAGDVDAVQDAAQVGEPSLTARLREMRREHLEAIALPADLVRARVLAGSVCEQGWREQRPANDWAGFLENFRPVVALAREAADGYREAFGSATRYEALLSLYCHGDDPERVASMFGELRTALPPLLERILERQRRAPIPTVAGPFPLAAQERLGRTLAARLGFAFDSGRLDVSAHPFSTGERGDLRITTRYREDDVFDALMAIAHEVGHASYEGGLPERHATEPVARSRGMSVHESQSLFFEKHVFLAPGFLRAFAPLAREALPSLADVDDTTIRRSLLGVGPSPIRVEADEVTYPLHVMVRHDIESALMDGLLEPADVPDAWNDGMQSLLGLDLRGNVRDGCLQDIHWSDGSFGYFPSYTLGAINAAALAEAITRDLPTWREDLADAAASDVGPGPTMQLLRDWLDARVWSRGRSIDGQTLMREAIGGVPDPSALLAHLERRYLENAD